jgi:hypothetical protein
LARIHRSRPIAVPSTSRVPSTDTTRVWETTCDPTRTLQKVASQNTYGNGVWVRPRVRPQATNPTIPGDLPAADGRLAPDWSEDRLQTPGGEDEVEHKTADQSQFFCRADRI